MAIQRGKVDISLLKDKTANEVAFSHDGLFSCMLSSIDKDGHDMLELSVYSHVHGFSRLGHIRWRRHKMGLNDANYTVKPSPSNGNVDGNVHSLPVFPRCSEQTKIWWCSSGNKVCIVFCDEAVFVRLIWVDIVNGVEIPLTDVLTIVESFGSSPASLSKSSGLVSIPTDKIRLKFSIFKRVGVAMCVPLASSLAEGNRRIILLSHSTGEQRELLSLSWEGERTWAQTLGSAAPASGLGLLKAEMSDSGEISVPLRKLTPRGDSSPDENQQQQQQRVQEQDQHDSQDPQYQQDHRCSDLLAVSDRLRVIAVVRHEKTGVNSIGNQVGVQLVRQYKSDHFVSSMVKLDLHLACNERSFVRVCGLRIVDSPKLCPGNGCSLLLMSERWDGSNSEFFLHRIDLHFRRSSTVFGSLAASVKSEECPMVNLRYCHRVCVATSGYGPESVQEELLNSQRLCIGGCSSLLSLIHLPSQPVLALFMGNQLQVRPFHSLSTISFSLDLTALEGTLKTQDVISTQLWMKKASLNVGLGLICITCAFEMIETLEDQETVLIRTPLQLNEERKADKEDKSHQAEEDQISDASTAVCGESLVVVNRPTLPPPQARSANSSLTTVSISHHYTVVHNISLAISAGSNLCPHGELLLDVQANQCWLPRDEVPRELTSLGELQHFQSGDNLVSKISPWSVFSLPKGLASELRRVNAVVGCRSSALSFGRGDKLRQMSIVVADSSSELVDAESPGNNNLTKKRFVSLAVGSSIVAATSSMSSKPETSLVMYVLDCQTGQWTDISLSGSSTDVMTDAETVPMKSDRTSESLSSATSVQSFVEPTFDARISCELPENHGEAVEPKQRVRKFLTGRDVSTHEASTRSLLSISSHSLPVKLLERHRSRTISMDSYESDNVSSQQSDLSSSTGSLSSVVGLAAYDDHSLITIAMRRSKYYLEVFSLLRSCDISKLQTSHKPNQHELLAFPTGFCPRFMDCVLLSGAAGGKLDALTGGRGQEAIEAGLSPTNSFVLLIIGDGANFFAYKIQAYGICDSARRQRHSTRQSLMTTTKLPHAHPRFETPDTLRFGLSTDESSLEVLCYDIVKVWETELTPVEETAALLDDSNERLAHPIRKLKAFPIPNDFWLVDLCSNAAMKQFNDQELGVENVDDSSKGHWREDGQLSLAMLLLDALGRAWLVYPKHHSNSVFSCQLLSSGAYCSIHRVMKSTTARRQQNTSFGALFLSEQPESPHGCIGQCIWSFDYSRIVNDRHLLTSPPVLYFIVPLTVDMPHRAEDACPLSWNVLGCSRTIRFLSCRASKTQRHKSQNTSTILKLSWQPLVAIQLIDLLLKTMNLASTSNDLGEWPPLQMVTLKFPRCIQVLSVSEFRAAVSDWLCEELATAITNSDDISQSLIRRLEVLFKNCLEKLSFVIGKKSKQSQAASKFWQFKYRFLTRLLYVSSERLFMEVLSRLARKLEPEVTSHMFPVFVGCKDIEEIFREQLLGPGLSPLDLFEISLRQGQLEYASRFLSLACESLGGSEDMFSTRASLVLALELLYICCECCVLDIAVQCAEFCCRLECALEYFHSPEARRTSGLGNSSTKSQSEKKSMARSNHISRNPEPIVFQREEGEANFDRDNVRRGLQLPAAQPTRESDSGLGGMLMSVWSSVSALVGGDASTQVVTTTGSNLPSGILTTRSSARDDNSVRPIEAEYPFVAYAAVREILRFLQSRPQRNKSQSVVTTSWTCPLVFLLVSSHLACRRYFAAATTWQSLIFSPLTGSRIIGLLFPSKEKSIAANSIETVLSICESFELKARRMDEVKASIHQEIHTPECEDRVSEELRRNGSNTTVNSAQSLCVAEQILGIKLPPESKSLGVPKIPKSLLKGVVTVTSGSGQIFKPVEIGDVIERSVAERSWCDFIQRLVHPLRVFPSPTRGSLLQNLLVCLLVDEEYLFPAACLLAVVWRRPDLCCLNLIRLALRNKNTNPIREDSPLEKQQKQIAQRICSLYELIRYTIICSLSGLKYSADNLEKSVVDEAFQWTPSLHSSYCLLYTFLKSCFEAHSVSAVANFVGEVGRIFDEWRLNQMHL